MAGEREPPEAGLSCSLFPGPLEWKGPPPHSPATQSELLHCVLLATRHSNLLKL